VIARRGSMNWKRKNELEEEEKSIRTEEEA